MKDFIHTGYYALTKTTVNDPLLRVVEEDNGLTWEIRFYVNWEIIDRINMEHLVGSKLNEDVLALKVYNEENNFVGTLENRLNEAIQLTYY